MTNLPLRTVLLALLCLAQLAVPSWLLARQELTLQDGEQFKFACEPVDPVDVFRGRYVALGFAQRSVDLPAEMSILPGERVYVRVENGEDGFARLSDPSTKEPDGGAYLRARVLRPTGNGQLFLRLPFDRYYLEEEAAPQAEQLYWEHLGDDTRRAHVTVRLWNGHAALEELYLDDVPIGEVLSRPPRPSAAADVPDADGS
jgi:uncharacterized membrane-anchored protein